MLKSNVRLIGVFAFAILFGAAQWSLGQDVDIADELIEAPTVKSERIQDSPFKPLSQIRFDLSTGDDKEQRVPETKALTPTTAQAFALPPKSVQWYPSNLRYNRPYFEELLLERHGLAYRPKWQTTISAVRFFGTAALLPILRWRKGDCHMYDHRAFGNPGSPLCNNE